MGSREPPESGNRDGCLKHQVHVRFHPVSSGSHVGATKSTGEGPRNISSNVLDMKTPTTCEQRCCLPRPGGRAWGQRPAAMSLVKLALGQVA